MQYETSIILSDHINPDGSLDEPTEARVNKSIELYFEDTIKAITMSGGYADKEAPCTHAEAMKLYALGRNVDKKDIYSEEESLDTIGQAVFSKRIVIIPENWEKLIVISHDYHIRRVKVIFDFVYGKDFDIKYVDIHSVLGDDENTLNKEKISLEAFLKTFKGISPGNDEDIFNRLFESHSLYKNIKNKI